jgi:hypothetical protein
MLLKPASGQFHIAGNSGRSYDPGYGERGGFPG